MINIVKKYLVISQFSDQKENFEDLFLSHPNYPGVFAITDSLDMLSIENIAIKVPKEQFIELPKSFLAIYNNNLVLATKSNAVITIDTKEGKQQKLTFNEFLTGWNEVILAIEPNTNSIIKKEKANTKWLLYTLPFIALIILSITYNKYNYNSTILLATSITGLLTSIFIVQEAFGIKSEIVSKFCNVNQNVSCDSVIKSNKNEINKWFGFSDLPLLFFSISILSTIIQTEEASNIIGFLSLAATPIIMYSVWLQKFQLKKWCVLCLVVSFIIVLQSLVFIFATTSFFNIIIINGFGFLFSAILLTTIWLFVKPVFEAKIKAEKRETELKKFKCNYQIFRFLSKKIPVLKGFDKLEGLQFGNKTASLQLTIIISPSCGHCHKALEDGFNLVTKFPKRVFLSVLFNINPENNDNLYKIIVETLLTINNINPENIESAISDWHIKKMDLQPWLEKWKMNTVDMKVNHQIYKQYNWCLENEFNYTPVKIINNKLFPNEYEISELKYFLNDFLKEKAENYILAEA
ncbi:Vitamin K epoxide reductase family protein [Flavobacterium swingsii]|uniref:Vitamin K epoxide reductase family protein n=1 Tax=Flavobacterium swingsii TaxID=498292 RepID=A0A1I0XIF9_9FLAO|nr:vitamin K epoxide reductase family protein [Flavobacterium swingsii]SFB00467.1 Vitamin K epoxide reductase family protein [Flavobacterium swingsii]